MLNKEDQETNSRRRRSSITIAILQRRHVTAASDYIPYSEDDDIYLLNHYDRHSEHAILGFKNRAISSPVLFMAPGTSSTIQRIEQFNIIEDESVLIRPTTSFVRQTVGTSESIQNVDKINIIRGKGITIGPRIGVFTQKLKTSGSTDNINESEIVRAVKNAVNSSTSLQNIDQINIFEGIDIRVGPTIEIMTNTDETEENILEPIPLTDLESETAKPKKQNRIRCNVAVFVCFSMVVGCSIIFHVAYKVPGGKCGNHNNPPPYKELSIREWWYMCRWSWEAEIPRDRVYLDTPVHYVIIGHSELNYCDEKETCVEKVLAMQKNDKLGKLWLDIGPNFLVTPNALVFEGRGANVEGNMLSDNNNKSITIMFLGDYERNQTCPEQFDHLNVLLTELVNEGVLAKDYSLLGECQISEEPLVSPGPNVMEELERLDHWNPWKKERCITRGDLENQRVDFIAQNMHG